MKHLNKRIFFTTLLFIFSTFFLFSQSNKPYAKNIAVTYYEVEKKLSINWENPLSNNISKIYVYHDDKPITSKNQLTKDKILTILDKSKNSYLLKDTKLFTPYFAVIYQLEDYSFYDVLIPSENTTIYNGFLETKFSELSNSQNEKSESVENVAEVEILREGKLRKTPLPTIKIENANYEGLLQTEKIEVSPFIFDEEKVENPLGVSYEIYSIIANYYIEENYAEAAKELEFLLQNKFDEKTTARLYFYLGECYFFTEKYKKAIDCFFLSEKQYPDISKRWQQYALNNISF